MSFLKTLTQRMIQHDCAGLAAEMCYNWMISLLPMIIFIFTLFGLMNAQPELFAQVARVLQRLIPGEAFHMVEASIRALIADSTSELALLSLLASLWTASNGAVTLEKAFIRFYGMESRTPGFWQQRAIAILLILGLAFIVLVCANLIIFGELIIQILQTGLNLPNSAIDFMSWGRWALSVSSLLVISWFVYSMVPRPLGPQSWKKMWPGALVFVPLWILFSFLFSQYVHNMGNYSKIYGPMGAIIILMIWLYLTSFALLVGGEVNALLLEQELEPAPSESLS
ncbi:YihY/virulence factor BrkB family protein [Vampirovibrio sp.]|uniref:YihY/virulence factor BrkB family protein n=1 Tax=Vampirovibrio sp. TaxID=2717857 RepID=UPI0035935B69